MVGVQLKGEMKGGEGIKGERKEKEEEVESGAKQWSGAEGSGGVEERVRSWSDQGIWTHHRDPSQKNKKCLETDQRRVEEIKHESKETDGSEGQLHSFLSLYGGWGGWKHSLIWVKDVTSLQKLWLNRFVRLLDGREAVWASQAHRWRTRFPIYAAAFN